MSPSTIFGIIAVSCIATLFTLIGVSIAHDRACSRQHCAPGRRPLVAQDVCFCAELPQ